MRQHASLSEFVLINYRSNPHSQFPPDRNGEPPSLNDDAFAVENLKTHRPQPDCARRTTIVPGNDSVTILDLGLPTNLSVPQANLPNWAEPLILRHWSREV